MCSVNNYFSHDSNARNSDKIIPLRMKYGAEGYGIYFMLLERLREEPEYMSVKDYNMLAFDLRVDSAKVKSVIEDFGLFVFTEDGKYFYSESFKKRMEKKDAKRSKLSEAGKRGNEKRWGKKREELATQSPPDRICDEILSQEKKSKEKKETSPKGESKKCEISLPPDSKEDSLDSCHEELKNDQTWMETVCMNIRSSGHHDFTPSSFYQYLDCFFKKLQNEGVTYKTPKDAKAHFARWLHIELKNEKNERRTDKNKNGYSSEPKSTEAISPRKPDWLDNQTGTLEDFVNSIPIGR